jgi:ribosomal protein S18 acetylase RimI-like enzyme
MDWDLLMSDRHQFHPLDVSGKDAAVAVLELQRESYAVEARLIGSNDIPPLHESVEELQTSGETFLGVLVDGRLVGFVSWKIEGATVDLHRLVVSPGHFRRGYGAALVRAALDANPDAERAIVQTGASNSPAKALYVREGFIFIDEIEPVPGLRVARFSKQLSGV